MNVWAKPDPLVRTALYSRAAIRSGMGGYQRTPKDLYPLDKATLVVWAITWYSNPN